MSERSAPNRPLIQSVYGRLLGGVVRRKRGLVVVDSSNIATPVRESHCAIVVACVLLMHCLPAAAQQPTSKPEVSATGNANGNPNPNSNANSNANANANSNANNTANATNSPAPAAAPRVEFVTTQGTIIIECDVEKAPRSALNFMEYVADGFYDGTIIHRISGSGFIQGGEYLPNMDRKTASLRKPVRLESFNSASNKRGTIALVHGLSPHSATTGFFINLKDNGDTLDFSPPRSAGYAVFGHVVVKHMDTVDRIAQTPVDTHAKYAAGRLAVVPTKPVIIKSARLLDKVETLERVRKTVAALVDAKPPRTLAQMLDEFIKKKEKETGLKFEKTETDLLLMDLRVGLGPVPTFEDHVSIHYRGWLVTGREFENSLAQQTPPVYLLDDLNDGLREAIASMHVGGKRIAIIPPEMGYGEDGIPYGDPPRIPPYSTIIYEVELLDLKDGKP